MKKISLSLLFVIAISFASFTQMIVGYVPAYRTIEVMEETINWGNMTDAYYFGATPSTSGGINLEYSEKFDYVKQKALDYKINLWLSIGGWNKSANFPGLAANATARQTFADNLVDFCATHELSGVDIDWEFPTSTQSESMKLLFKTIYETFEADGRGFKLSAAAGGEQAHADNWDSGSFQYLDHLNLMSYDAPSNVSDNHASLEFLKEGMDIYHEAGCPYEKMLGGVAFYSRPSIRMYSEILNAASTKEAKDEIFLNDGSGQVKYNGKTTLEDKIDYVVGEKGGVGVLIWEVTQDIKDEEYSLLKVLDDKMEDYRCPLPKPNLGEDVSICGSSFVTLDAGVSGDISYKWHNESGVINGASSKTYNAPTAGVYQVEVTDGSCSNFAEVEVLGILPEVNIGPDAVLCDPVNHVFNADLGGNGINYVWKRNDEVLLGVSSQTYTAIKAGTYAVEVSATGCGSKTDEAIVTSSLLSVEEGEGCPEDDISLAVLDNNGPYEWFLTSSSEVSESEGNSFTYKFSETKTMYVWKKETFTGQTVGPEASTYSNAKTTAHTNKQVLTLESEMKLNSIKLKSGGAGVWIDTRLTKPNGETVKESQFNVGANSVIDWEIDMTLQPGEYHLSAYIRSGSALFNTDLKNEFSIPSVASLKPEEDYLKNATGNFGMYYDIHVTAGYKNVCAKTPVTATILDDCTSNGLPKVTLKVNKESVCEGDELEFTATAIDAGLEPELTWTVNGVEKQISTSVNFKTQTLKNDDVVIVSLTSDETVNSSQTMIITSTPVKPIIEGDLEYCEGETIMLSVSDDTQVEGATYEWTRLGFEPADLSTATVDFELTDAPVHEAEYWVKAINHGCESESSDEYVIVKEAPQKPVLGINKNASSFCVGENVVFSATSETSGVSFVWSKGSASGTWNEEVSITSLSTDDAGLYSVKANYGGCESKQSDVLELVVNEIPEKPVISTLTNTQEVCSGDNITLVASSTEGVLFEWTKGVATGLSNEEVVITNAILTHSGSYEVKAKNGMCESEISDVFELTVNETPLQPVINSSSNSNDVCTGGDIVLIASTTAVGTSFKWSKGIASGDMDETVDITNAGEDNIGIYTVEAIKGDCKSVESEVFELNVADGLEAALQVEVDKEIICPNEEVLFTAIPTNGGDTPIYSWFLNDEPTGQAGETYSVDNLNNADEVKAMMVSSSTCLVTSEASSNTITMSVGEPVEPKVSVLMDEDEVCEGATVEFTAIPENGGLPSYKWFIGSIVQYSTTETLTAVVSDGDEVKVEMMTSLTCVKTSTVMSDVVTLDVTDVLLPSIMIEESVNDICEGTEVELNLSSSNEGELPSYEWYLNGEGTGEINESYSSFSFENEDEVKVVLSTWASCASAKEVSSNVVTVTVKEKVSNIKAFEVQDLEQKFDNYNMDLSDYFYGYDLSYMWDETSVVSLYSSKDILTVESTSKSGAETVTIIAEDVCGFISESTVEFKVMGDNVIDPEVTINKPTNSSINIDEDDLLRVDFDAVAEQGELTTVSAKIKGYAGEVIDEIDLDQSGDNYSGKWRGVVGVYELEIIVEDDQGGVTVESKEIIVWEVISSVGTLNGIKAISAYPNPFSDKVVIEFNTLAAQNVDVAVYNLIGVPVAQENTSLGSGTSQLQFDTTDWSSGMYIVTITSDQGVHSIKVEK